MLHSIFSVPTEGKQNLSGVTKIYYVIFVETNLLVELVNGINVVNQIVL